MFPQSAQPGYKAILEKNDAISCLFTFVPCWWMNLLCCCCSYHSLLILEPSLFSSPRFLQAFCTTLRLRQHSASWSVKLLGSQHLQGEDLPFLYSTAYIVQPNLIKALSLWIHAINSVPPECRPSADSWSSEAEIMNMCSSRFWQLS